MSRLRVLVSGGTGFLGQQLMPLLKAVAHVTGLSRTDEDCLRADLSLWDGGLEPQKLKGSFDIFLHMAGLYDLRAEARDAFTQNIAGTHTALSIAQQAEIPHFIHISTVAAAMNQRGAEAMISADSLSDSYQFPDAYSESKAHAEKLVRNWKADSLKSRLILRLGVLVGNTQDGKILRIDGPYHAPESLKRIQPLLERFPGPIPVPGREGRLPIVPVDVTARAIVNLLLKSRNENWLGTHALYIVPDNGPSAEDLFRSCLNRLGIKKDLVLASRLPDWLLKPAAEMLAKLPDQELEYLLNFPKFDLSATEAALGADWCPAFAEYEDAFWRGYEIYVSHR